MIRRARVPDGGYKSQVATWRRGKVRVSRGGVTIMANNTHKVKGTVTLRLTGTKGLMIVGCGNSRRGTQRAGTRVRTTNNRTSVLRYGITSFSTYRTFFGTITRGCKHISVLMGGTKIAGSKLLVGVDRRSFSEIISVGLGKAFGYVHRISEVVLGREDNQVVDLSSIMNLHKGTKRTGCTTSGTKVVNLAGSTTGRLTSEKVAIGTVTPKFVGASVASILSSGMGRGVTTSVPVKDVKAARSITGTTTFLTSSNTHCVAKRMLHMSNKVTVWEELPKIEEVS